MEVKKIANFSKEELDALTKAGEIAGETRKAIESGTIDELSTEALNLVKALSAVFAKISL